MTVFIAVNIRGRTNNMEVVTIGNCIITICYHCEELIYVKDGDAFMLNMAVESHFEENDMCRKHDDELPTLNDIKGLMKDK